MIPSSRGLGRLRRVSTAVALAVAAAVSVSALSFSGGTGGTTKALSITYSPDANAQASGKVVVKKGTYTGGVFSVVFTLVSLSPASSPSLSYAAYAPAATLANQLSLTGAPTGPSQVLTGTFASNAKSNTTITLDFAFVVMPATLPPPGTYVATIDESLYGTSYLPTGTAYSSNTLTVTVTVGAHYDVSVVPTGNSFSLTSTSQALDFGSLSQGSTLGADILVRANVSYSLSLSSANSGSLVDVVDPTSLVGYSLMSNGVGYSLSPGPALIAGGAAATFGSPQRYALAFTILPLPTFPTAGTYTDTITITLSSP